MYVSAANEYSDQAQTDPTAEPVQDAIEQISKRLYSRFRDLDSSGSEMSSSARLVRMKVHGIAREFQRVKIRSQQPENRTWTGDLWLDLESGLIWRARLSVREDAATLVHEDLRWLEITSGRDVPLHELDWRAPAGVGRVDRFPYTLPI